MRRRGVTEATQPRDRARPIGRLAPVRRGRGWTLLLVLLGPAASASDAAPGADAGPGESRTIAVEDLVRRLERLEEQNARLAEENRGLRRQVEDLRERHDRLDRRIGGTGAAAGLPARLTPDPPLPSTARPASIVPAPSTYWEPASPGDPPGRRPPRFQVGDYDAARGAFVLVRPVDPGATPFELRADLFTQARYLGFARSTDQWVDSTGTPRPIRNFSSVEITRNFLAFSGYGLDPRLQYSIAIFSSTALNDTVFLGWINYHFSDAFDLRVGNWIVPGTREWFESFRYTLGAERLMATTFFRPNISPGIWAQGEPISNVHYVAMLANSVNRFTQGVERIGTGVAFGGTVWWEPGGDFGPGPSDIEYHEGWSPRLGTSLTISREVNQATTAINSGNPEDTILRLSDGTPLFRVGSLGPGVDLRAAAVQLWSIDAAIKYRGLGLSGEYFLRWLDGFDFRAGRSPINRLFDHGGLLQGGYFVVPRKLEFFARTSFVTGAFGGGYEVGGGLNWYVLGSREWRMTLEVLRVVGSPAQNVLTGYRAGEGGMLYQLQWFSDF